MNLKQRNDLLAQICSVIKQNKTFFLSGHHKPDGDTVASELAMASMLSRLRKSVVICNQEPVPSSLHFLPGIRKIRSAHKIDGTFDVAIIFECNSPERMGNIIDLKKQAKTVINIDHHLKHGDFGDINFVNSKASSNSEQLYYLFEKMGMPITRDEAKCLYVGIMADTGRFQHSNTNAETLRISSKLLEKEIQPHILVEKIYGTRSFPALKLLAHCLTDLKMSPDGKIARIKITKDDFSRTQSTEDETEEIVNYGLMIPSALISILLREGGQNGTVKVSLRSRRNVNVCRLAEQFGGGGHKYASGCKISGNIDDVSELLFHAAQKILK